MTKPLLAAAALLLACALAPAASAHGAPPVRELDLRVLLDDDGAVGYGGCLDGSCMPGAGGLDLLALDVREAYLPDGSPAVAFRILMQSEEPAAGASLVLHVDAPGGAKDLRVDTADGLAFTSASFDRLDGPLGVGDGHPKALDGWVKAASLGAKPGDALSGLTVSSLRGDATDDVMPGGWFSNGVEVPVVPAEPDPSAVSGEDEPGSYTLAGPAALVTLSGNGTADLASGPATVNLTLANAVGLEQFANLTVVAPSGVSARLAQTQALLGPSGTRAIELTVDNATADGTVQVAVTTDLGGRAVASVPVKAMPRQGGLDRTSDGNATSTAPANDKDAPGAGLLLVPALAAVALLRRRR